MRKLFENKRLAKLASFLRPLSQFFLVLSPNLAVELEQAEYKVKPTAFATIALLLSLNYTVLILAVLLFFLYLFEILILNNVLIVLGLIFVFFLFSTFNLMNLPKLYLIRKSREIDVSLLFALRHMLVKVKSGIPFFDSVVGIAYGNYGAVSKEFRKFVKDVQGGQSEIIALEKLSFYNPSTFLRRFIWQMTNSLRAGTDIASTLEVIVKGIEDERYLQVKEFGSRLSPIALMYIMFTVIIPALGTTFMTIFSTFIGGVVSDELFYLIPVLLILANLFFINVIRNTRPVFETS